MDESNLPKSIGASIMILPFHIVNHESNRNCFADPKARPDIVMDYKYLTPFIEKLNTFSFNDKGLLKRDLYYDFITAYFDNAKLGSKQSFLQLYAFKLDALKNHENSLVYNKNIIYQFINYNTKFKISAINVIVNPKALLGYFCFTFEYQYTLDFNNLLEQLSQIPFFRYYKDGNTQNNKNKAIEKYALKIFDEKKIETGDNDIFTIAQLIKNYFYELLPHIYFPNDRPVLLHLLSDDRIQLKDRDNLYLNCFKTLRIRPNETVVDTIITEELKQSVLMPEQNICLFTLNEGAIVIDLVRDKNGKLKDHPTLINSYFVAFILALNQREVMLKVNQLIAIEDNNGEKLEVLYDWIHQVHIQQFMYTISSNNEIESFFEQLMLRFKIKVLLEDNKESISDIYSIINTRKEKIEVEQEEKRDNLINLFLGIVGCLGVFSFVKDSIYFLQDKEVNTLFKFIPYLAFSICSILLVHFIYSWPFKKKGK